MTCGSSAVGNLHQRRNTARATASSTEADDNREKACPVSRKGRRAFGLALACLIWAVFFAPTHGSAAADLTTVLPGAAQTGSGEGKDAQLPERLTREQVRELVSRLSDQDVRELLIRQLDRVATEPGEPGADAAGFVAAFEDSLDHAHERLGLIVSAIPDLPAIGPLVFSRLTQPDGPSAIWMKLLFAVLVFAGGFAGERLFRRLFTRFGEYGTGDAAGTVVDKLCILGIRFVVQLMGIAVYGLCAAGVFFAFYQGHELTREAIAAAFWTVILIRVASAITRFAIAPTQSWLRVPPVDDKTAVKVYRPLVLIAGSIISALYLSEFLARVGLEPGLTFLVDTILSFLVLALIAALIWLDRTTIARMILAGSLDPERPGRVRQILADNAHVFLTCIIVGMWMASMVRRLLTGEGEAAAIITSLCVILALPVADWIIRATVSGLLGVSEAASVSLHRAIATDEPEPEATDQGEREEAREATLRAHAARLEYRDVLVHSLRIVLGVLAVVILAHVWDIDLQRVAAQGIGQTLAGALVDIVITLVLAFAAWGVVKTAIKHAVPDEGIGGEPEPGEIGGKGGTRLQTLIPLLGRFLLITLAVTVTMIVLSELGVDVGPLIAGAGVVGIAVGFGAQTLVRDILSGMFFLLDDAFRVGEYIDVGSVKGMVEHISIRSLRLRHHRGPIHTVPFGEIQHLTNYSRDWAVMKLELRVPFDTDLERVRKIIKQVGKDLMSHPEHGANFLQPVKSQGVHRMDDSAFIVRVKFMAKPGEQFTLRREVFSRIQETFAEHGIRFAPRRVIVDTGAGVSAAAAAAAAASGSEGDAETGPTAGGLDA
jgi:small-conductance mechanosensitive channel